MPLSNPSKALSLLKPLSWLGSIDASSANPVAALPSLAWRRIP